jgi:hypothetical protein
MPTIEISDKNERRLSFDLVDLLRIIEPFCRELDWYFIEFQLGSFYPAHPPDPEVESWVLTLWHAIERRKGGIKVSWDTLLQFAKNVRQTDSCLLLGLKAGSAAPQEPLDLNGTELGLVVQAVDSSFWAVTTRNEALIGRLRDHFRNIEVVEGTRRYH